MNIGNAINLMKNAGMKLTRDDSKYYLIYVPSYKYEKSTIGIDTTIIHTERILIVDKYNNANVWNPTQEDLLAEDYIIKE